MNYKKKIDFGVSRCIIPKCNLLVCCFCCCCFFNAYHKILIQINDLYLQEKRIKKRTFLRRPETGSVDDGIMDAMIMSELGEKRQSRVQKIGARPKSSSKTIGSSRQATPLTLFTDHRPGSSRGAEFSDVIIT